MARILLLGLLVPTPRGGAEFLTDDLASALSARGHEVVRLELPIRYVPKEDILDYVKLWENLDLRVFEGKPVDLVIGTKFPNYYARHPRKSIWLIHQHRQIYDLYDTEYSDFTTDLRDEALRQTLLRGDDRVFRDASYVAAISKTVARRLLTFNEVTADVLYPPLPCVPLNVAREDASEETFILSVGRLAHIKRHELAIHALKFLPPWVKLKVVGAPDVPEIMGHYHALSERLGVSGQISFLGTVPPETLRTLYATCRAVYFAPYEEDFGYVTLEAFAAGKPVVTTFDSGGPLEFVEDGVNGFISDPTPDAVAKGLFALVQDSGLASRLGRNGLELVRGLKLGEKQWDVIIQSLLSPLTEARACA